MTSILIAPSRSAEPQTLEQGARSITKLRSALSSRVYLPACWIVVVAAVLVGIGWSSGWGGGAFVGSLTSLQVVTIGPLSLAFIGAILVVERVWPAQRRSLFARGYRHDLLFTIFNAALVVPLVTALTLSFDEVVRRLLPWMVLPKMGPSPHVGVIVLLLVAVDGCNWFAHLANHHIRMLWRFHELHHSQEDMNVLTVFRTHPLIHVSYLISLVPGLVLLANGSLSITVLALYGAIVAFAHSNTRLGFGPLGRIVVSPNFHRIHHQLDGPQDVNMGFVLTIWDQMFHTAVFPTQETVRADTGLPGRPLLVEQERPASRQLSVFAAQMWGPFRPLDKATNQASDVRDAEGSSQQQAQDEQYALHTAARERVEEDNVEEREVA
ncbi:MAG TPA: sterol desaturase family protein [Acidimicrobiales bacterium]|nr:sterol desaturase family protein [Acidimicrobiales bacterium]